MVLCKKSCRCKTLPNVDDEPLTTISVIPPVQQDIQGQQQESATRTRESNLNTRGEAYWPMSIVTENQDNQQGPSFEVDKTKLAWHEFARVLDRVFLIVYSVAILLSLIFLLPRPTY